MKRTISLLTGLLVFQCLLAGMIFVFKHQQSNSFTPTVLLNIQQTDIDRIVLGDVTEEIGLTKQNDGWQLAEEDTEEEDVSSEKEPSTVDEAKVTHLLTTLMRLQTTWPVTTTAASHDRFEVAENNYRRKITLYSGDTQVAQLFVGTSPGFKQSHVRVAEQDEVYALEFNAYDVPIDRAHWLLTENQEVQAEKEKGKDQDQDQDQE